MPANCPDLIEVKGTLKLMAPLLKKLAEERERRIKPLVDDKVIVSWNALAIRIFAEASISLQEPRFLETAQNSAAFILNNMFEKNILFRIWKDEQLSTPAFLEDYAALSLALLDLFQVDQNTMWLHSAEQLMRKVFVQFIGKTKGLFDTDKNHDGLIYRPKNLYDNTTPSGNSMAALASIILFHLTGDPYWYSQADTLVKHIIDQAAEYPSAYSFWLQASDFLIGPVVQIAILKSGDPEEFSRIISTIRKKYRPRKVLVYQESETGNRSGLLSHFFHQRKLLQGKTTVFVCKNFSCQLPTTDAAILETLLNNA